MSKGFVGIYGKLTDARTREALVEAQVRVVNPAPGKSAVCDVDGNYRLKLPPGTYDLRVFYELYKARRVGNVVVRAGAATRLDVELTSDKDAVQEVVVEAKADTTTEAVQVVRRRKAATVSDAVSAEQIARSPDSSASDAAKRVVGTTIQDNKYVIVRGLAGRYSITLLNGVPVPSPDPDVPAAPLDIFPAALLANLTVAKTFTPDIPGDFAGGALSIETRSFPTRFLLKLSLKVSGDTESTFRESNAYKGGGADALGFDDGTRALPKAVPGDRVLPRPLDFTDQFKAQGQSFSNNWSLIRKLLPPGLALNLTIGDTVSRRGQKFGYFASVNYGATWTRRIKSIRSVASNGGTIIPSPLNLVEEEASERANLGALLALGWTPATGHQVSLTGVYAHTADNTASVATGTDISGEEGRQVERRRLRFVDRSLLVSQLVGEHSLARGRIQLGWQGNIARVSQDEPDTRDLLRLRIDNGPWTIGDVSNSATRLYSTLTDITGGGGADLALVLKPLRIKIGGSYLHSSRDYQARRFEFLPLRGTGVAQLPPDQAFAPGRIGTDVSFGELTLDSDGLRATRGIGAAFALIDITASKWIRILAGARVEVADLRLVSRAVLKPDLVSCQPPACDPSVPPARALLASRNDVDVLPALSVVGFLTDSMNLRAAYGMTVARPNFRELSPALYQDYARRRAIGGNPNLLETRIQNADLRWELFFGSTELVAASVFYKFLDRPIERTLTDAGSGYNVSFENEKQAQLYGGELEARISLGRLWKPLSGFTLGGNLSLIFSEINVSNSEKTATVKRNLQGQSPYVVNLDLGYHHVVTGTRIQLLYNLLGPRIDEVGVGLPNVIEEPFHRLDLTFTQQLPAKLRLKIAAVNLLNRRVSFTQGGIEILGYEPGVGFSGTLELNLE